MIPALLLGAALEFRNIGPFDGRLDTVAGVPSDPAIYYAGGLGGMFKSTNGGETWSSIFNNEPVSSISAIAVAPSNPSILYAGTGEQNLRNDVAFGDGMWRSSDAGKTWTHDGLDATGSIAAVAVDASNPDRVFVAALGDVYRASTDRGIYRTTDGGKTWQKVLYTDDRTGGSSIAIDPADPNVIFAGMWEGWRNAYHLTSGGPNDGIYESTDGGDHWTRLQGHGLPSGVTGRIALAFAPSNPQRIYAMIESSQGTLWRSDDRGKTWTMVNTSHGIDQRPFYFTSLAVDPKNENHVYFMSVEIWQTTDGGKTVHTIKRPAGFGDNHQMWIDPSNPARLAVASDDGIAVSVDGTNTLTWKPMPIAQPYHLDVDDRVPYTICAEDQDAGSACGPSNSLEYQGIGLGDFFYAGGGESGWILFDRADSNIIYGDGYQGSLTRFDRRTTQVHAINVWPEDAMGWPAAPLKYRFQWTSPLAMPPQHPHRLFMGGNRIFETDDGGATWRPISPDLTRNNKARQQLSGTPLTPDNTSVEYYNVVFSIGPSSVRDGEIWAGTDDGRVWLTRDDGSHWQNVTPPQFRFVPKQHWLRVDYVAPSPFDAATAYVAADAHKWGDRAPHLFVTHDYGKSWSVISNGLPQNSYTRMIRPDPFRRGMLYAGTETALWYSYDDGASWTQFGFGLPTAPYYDFKIQRRFDDLVVATHGRGIWILDDLHPLQEMSAAVRAQPLHLFTLRDAYRFELRPSLATASIWGENPGYGADVDFWLSAVPAHAHVTVEILDGAHVIRTIGVKKPIAGINRVWWNLRYDKIELAANYVPWNPGGFAGPLAIPGRYTVRVLAGGRTVQGSVRVLQDPRSTASPAALREQLAFVLRIRGDLVSLTKTIDRLQALKKKKPAQAAAIDTLLRRIYTPGLTQGEDALRVQERVYGRLSFLASDVRSGEAAPTRADYQVLRLLETQANTLNAQARAYF
ncbi:MAG TPA: hypothetical protein VMF11_02335 [Candidatus Baltobacteraceae bacterium]|nr:hypothetical protein [Candidatus Baltobacteraceae bacterium]